MVARQLSVVLPIWDGGLMPHLDQDGVLRAGGRGAPVVGRVPPGPPHLPPPPAPTPPPPPPFTPHPHPPRHTPPPHPPTTPAPPDDGARTAYSATGQPALPCWGHLPHPPGLPTLVTSYLPVPPAHAPTTACHHPSPALPTQNYTQPPAWKSWVYTHDVCALHFGLVAVAYLFYIILCSISTSHLLHWASIINEGSDLLCLPRTTHTHTHTLAYTRTHTHTFRTRTHLGVRAVMGSALLSLSLCARCWISLCLQAVIRHLD